MQKVKTVAVVRIGGNGRISSTLKKSGRTSRRGCLIERKKEREA